MNVEPFDEFTTLDIAIDGADQIAPGPWLVKGGGRAHTREKVVAAASARFVVIAGGEKVVERIHAPVPLELLAYGAAATLHRLQHAVVRPGPASPDGGVIADWTGPVEDPAHARRVPRRRAGRRRPRPLRPELVTDVVVARDGASTIVSAREEQDERDDRESEQIG